MQPDQFISSRQAQWKELGQLLDRNQANPAGLSTQEIDQLGRLYRAAASDLAVAQRDFPGHRAAAFLNQLVARAHAQLYRSEPLSLKRLWHYIVAGFPQACREAGPFIVVAALLLFGPALIAGISTDVEPASAKWLLPPEAQDLVDDIERQDLWVHIPVNERPYASSFIMRNNIQVSIMAFAGGMLAGTFTVYAMVYNGLLLGSILGLTMHYGVGFEMWSFVIGHGVIELTVICMAGGSGLMLGWAILQPGLLRRRDALAEAGKRAVKIVIGCIPLLVIAGTIEGFISPAENIPGLFKFGLGLTTGILLYSYLLFAGREKKQVWASK